MDRNLIRRRVFLVVLFFNFETESQYIAQADAELVLVLPLTLKCYNHRYVLLCPANYGLNTQFISIKVITFSMFINHVLFC